MRFTCLILAVAMLAVAGCKNGGSSSSNAALGKEKAPSPLSRVRTAQTPESLMLKAGPPPLTFIVAQGGSVRVQDATAGKTLVTARIDPGTIVAVDAKGGIMLGQRKAMEGPLSAEHRYEIWWEPLR